MFQVVAISLNPALLSFLNKYCVKCDPRWQLRCFPTIGSYVAAPRNEDSIDLLFFDAHDIVAGLEEKRLVCFMAPLALRVVITNTVNDDVVLEHLDHFHAFIGPSVDFEHLTLLFQNAEQLKHLPLPGVSRRILASFTHFPVFPEISTNLRKQLADPAVEVSRVARLLENDPVVVSRLMQLVNSPYMGFASETMSLEIAVSRLGMQVVEMLVLMLAIKGASSAVSAKEHAQVIEQALKFGNACRALAKQSNLKRLQQDHVFIAAILSCFGQLLLLQNGWMLDDPDLVAEQSDTVRPDVAISAYLLTLWGLDQKLIAPLLSQHQLIDGTEPQFLVSNCLYLARLTKPQLLALPDAIRQQIARSPFGNAVGIVH
jgi:HD-like signal output (HDOD) protein